MTYANLSDTALDLQLFGDGNAAAPGDGGENAGNIGAGDKSRGLDAAAANSKGAKNNPLADVIYGKNTDVPPDAEATNDAEIQQTKDLTDQKKDAPNKNAAFEEMINGEYKEAFNERVKGIVEKRLKSLKQTDSKYESLRPVLDMLAEKYGVDSSDTASLSKAIEEDNSFYEKEALEKGIPVENLKSIRKLERENNVLKQQIKDRESRESADRLYASWLDQANTAKSIYPGLSLENEIQNPKFVELLKSNIDVKTAYEVIHKDEIIPAAMQFAAKNAEEKLTNSIVSGQARPAESGMGRHSSAIVKNDVTKLSKEDRQEIIRRVQRGEIIKF